MTTDHTLSDEELDAIEAIEQAATSSPWSVMYSDGATIVVCQDDSEVCSCGCDGVPRATEDAAFIAAARNASPALIRQAREANALRKRVAELKAAIAEARRQVSSINDNYDFAPNLQDDINNLAKTLGGKQWP